MYPRVSASSSAAAGADGRARRGSQPPVQLLTDLRIILMCNSHSHLLLPPETKCFRSRACDLRARVQDGRTVATVRCAISRRGPIKSSSHTQGMQTGQVVRGH